jgi:hypothetical protein
MQDPGSACAVRCMALARASVFVKHQPVQLPQHVRHTRHTFTIDTNTCLSSIKHQANFGEDVRMQVLCATHPASVDIAQHYH